MQRRLFMKAAAGRLACASAAELVAGPPSRQKGINAMPDYSSTGAETLRATPKADGFHYPAEWEEHD